jgi:hypothetical protein
LDYYDHVKIVREEKERRKDKKEAFYALEPSYAIGQPKIFPVYDNKMR